MSKHFTINDTLFLNGVEPGDQVLIADDLISTGGAQAALIRAIHKLARRSAIACALRKKTITAVWRG